MRDSGLRRVAARGRAGAMRATRRVRRATHAHGAGESGLAKLIELQAFNSAADTFVAISLAGTLFFSVPVGEARGRVALYLVLTMAPFAVLSPVIGPLLDRVPHGRRYAMATSFLVRAFFAWVLAGAVDDADLALYPAAFGALIASRAYGVTRSVAVPRLLPPDTPLVQANSRVSLAGLIAGTSAAPLAAGAAWLDPGWALRVGFVVFVTGAVLAFRLPARVDSAAGEGKVSLTGLGHRATVLRRTNPAVVLGLRANASLRALSGFLTIYLAFLLRDRPVGGLTDTAAIALAAAAAAGGGLLGVAAGSWLRSRLPEAVVVGSVALVIVPTALAALRYGVVTILVVAFIAGLAQGLAKIALDALVQRDVAESVRTSTFARSETLLQLSWVLGGVVGIALPLRPGLGLGVVTVAMSLALLDTARTGFRIRGRGTRPAAAPIETPPG